MQTNHDPDAEDETVVLAVSASGGVDLEAGSGTGEEPLRPVTLDDDETQSYTLALAPTVSSREGHACEVSAIPAHVDDSKALTLQIDDSSYALDTDDAADGARISGMVDGDNPSFTAEITPPSNDEDRVDDTVTAYSGSVGNATEEASRSFRVAGAHALSASDPVTVEARDAARSAGHVGAGRRGHRVDGLGGPRPRRYRGDRRGAVGDAGVGGHHENDTSDLSRVT